MIDPLSDNPVVAFGSHNLGYKASYGNDENLLIVQGNQALALAYAVHVLDVYDHYRFRAVQAEHSGPSATTRAKPAKSKKSAKTAPSAKAKSAGTSFNGFLQDNDGWQQDYLDGKRGPEAKYLAQGLIRPALD